MLRGSVVFCLFVALKEGSSVRKKAAQQLHKLLCLLLCTVLTGLLFVGVFATAENQCQLVLNYHYQDTAISGAAFRIYRVADLNSSKELIYTDAFSDFHLNADQLLQAREELFNRVEEKGLSPEKQLLTGTDGIAVANDLTPGAFLLVCEPAVVGNFVYYCDMQVLILKEDVLTLLPKSTRLPVGERLISIQAVKIWDDRGYENKRPREITVRLLKDGKTFDSAVLSGSNGWSHTWNDLLPNARWTVKEDVPKGYLATVEQSGNVFTLTNQYKNIPQTGHIWWPVLTVLGVGLLLVTIGLALRRSGRNEM